MEITVKRPTTPLATGLSPMILEGLKEADPSPSVRNVTAEYRIPSTRGSRTPTSNWRTRDSRDQTSPPRLQQCLGEASGGGCARPA